MSIQLLPPSTASPQRLAAHAWLQALDARDTAGAQALLHADFQHVLLPDNTKAGKDAYMRRLQAYAEQTERFETRIQDICENGEKVWMHTRASATVAGGRELKLQCVWMFRVQVDEGGLARISQIKEFLLEEEGKED